MTIKNGNQVDLTQKFSVPLDVLFAACLRGDLLKQCAGNHLKKSGNFEVGERYHAEIKAGADFIRGEFLKIILNQEIVFSWETLVETESTGITTITLKFSPSGKGSLLEFHQVGIASPMAAEDQDEGWTMNLAMLAERLDA